MLTPFFHNRATVSIRSAVRSTCCRLDKSALGCDTGGHYPMGLAAQNWTVSICHHSGSWIEEAALGGLAASAPTISGSIVISIGMDSGVGLGPRGWKVATPESMVSVNRSSPVASETSGSFGCSRLIFEFCVLSIQTTCSQVSPHTAAQIR